jgi:hypothetical protein
MQPLHPMRVDDAYHKAMSALQCIRPFGDEAPATFRERAITILLAMAPYNPTAAVFHIEYLGYAHG